MAGRCGCGGVICSCFIVDGDCTSASGAGSEINPYRVDVQVSATADNTLECAADGLYVPPFEETVTTLVDNGDGTVTYTNEDGAAVTVNVCDLLADGGCSDSLTATDNGDGTLTITHTALDGTVTQFVVDGNGAIGVADTATVDLTVTNGIVTADAILDCGLIETPNGIAVNVEDAANWPLACPIEQGSPVWCGADGRLYTLPMEPPVEDRAFVGGIPNVDAVTQAASFPVGAQTPAPGSDVQATITNNGCRPMRVEVCVNPAHGQHFIDGPGDQGFIVRPQIQVDGGGFNNVQGGAHTQVTVENMDVGDLYLWDTPGGDYCVDLGILAPGATITVDARYGLFISDAFNPRTRWSNASLGLTLKGIPQ